MRIVDTIVSREDGNSVWANVIFLGDGGETVSVRLPCPVPSGGQIGRRRIIKRSMDLLLGLASVEVPDQPAPPAGGGRFGVIPEAASGPHEPWPNMPSDEE